MTFSPDCPPRPSSPPAVTALRLGDPDCSSDLRVPCSRVHAHIARRCGHRTVHPPTDAVHLKNATPAGGSRWPGAASGSPGASTCDGQHPAACGPVARLLPFHHLTRETHGTPCTLGCAQTRHRDHLLVRPVPGDRRARRTLRRRAQGPFELPGTESQVAQNLLSETAGANAASGATANPVGALDSARSTSPESRRPSLR